MPSARATPRPLPLLYPCAALALALAVAGVAFAAGPSARIGGDADRYPFSYLDEAGRPRGFSVDLVSRAAEFVGLNLEFILGDPIDAAAAFQAGDLDGLLVDGLIWGLESEIDYSLSYMTSYYGLFVPAGSKISDAEDLPGKVIAARRDEHGVGMLESSGSGVTIRKYDDLREALAAAVKGEVDGAVAGYLETALALREYRRGTLVPAGRALFRSERRVATRRGEAGIAARLDEGFELAKATGAYEEIYRRWFGSLSAEPPGGATVGIFSAVAAISLIAGAAALAWVLAMRPRLKSRETELAAEKALRAEAQARLNDRITADEARDSEAKRSAWEESAFVAYINQELRTPLQGILGATELLEKTELDESQKRTLSMARSSAKRLSRILSDLLDAMGGESGSLRMEPTEFSYAEFSTWLESSLRPYAEERGLAFRFATEGDERLIHADRSRLAQVIINLGSNAIKYTAKGEVEIILSLGERALEVSVNDTGPGIPEEARASMFHPYRKAGRDGSPVSGSLGLGLSIVKSIVDAMGGKVSYRTERGFGTKFAVSLPVATRSLFSVREAEAGTVRAASQMPSPAAPRSASAPIPQVKPGRAIIAEDEAINRIYLKRVLESAGWEVAQAVDGEAALAAAEAGKWDFVLMDVSMPRMDGLEATRRIRAAEAEAGRARLPIIALTAHAYAEDRLACAESGMDGFLSKPFTEAALWSEVRRAVIAVATAASAAVPGARSEPSAGGV